VPDTPAPLPDFTRWPSFPFEGDIRVKRLDDPVDVEPPRKGEDPTDCTACTAPDDAYIWVSDRWRVRSMDRPTGLPMVLILESRSHLDLGDLPNMLAAELGVMTVRLERAIRSLDDVARVHVNRSGDGEAHLHLWFMGRPQGRLQLRGTFLSLWDEILPPVPEAKWRENLALVAAWLAEFGGTPLAAPPRIDWKAPAVLETRVTLDAPQEPDAPQAPDAAKERDAVDATDEAAEDDVPVTPVVPVPAQPTAPTAESSEASGPADEPAGELVADQERIRRPVPGAASIS
jgi:diadenosine tetraphosphate (Ap4A) HIT family hydrolase